MTLFLGMLFGAIGMAYLAWAKREHSGVFLLAGVLLMIFPYFVSSVIATFVLGAILAAAPFAARHFET